MEKQQLRRIKVISSHLREDDGVLVANTVAAKTLSELVMNSATQKKQKKETLNLNGLEDLQTYVGKDLGVSQYVKITQESINLFAVSTNDLQWIHVDPERAAESPFGSTIAHGFFTLSLAPMFAEEVLPNVGGIEYFINYGFNKIRFLAPVPVDSNLRCRFTLQELTENATGATAVIKLTFEVEDKDKPAAVCEWLVRFYKKM